MLQNEIRPKMFRCLRTNLVELTPFDICDPSLTLTQFCVHLKTMLFCTAYETLDQSLSDGLGCKDCSANTNLLTYLLTIIISGIGSSISSTNIDSRFLFISSQHPDLDVCLGKITDCFWYTLYKIYHIITVSSGEL